MPNTPTPFDDLDNSGIDVPLSKNTQPLPSRPGSLLSNLQSGRTLPSSNANPDDTVSAAPIPHNFPPNAPTPVAPSTPLSSPTGKLKIVPLPTLIGLAMAGGALAVVLIPALMRRLIPAVPIKTLPDTTVAAPDNSVPMLAPDEDCAPAIQTAPNSTVPVSSLPQEPISPTAAPPTVTANPIENQAASSEPSPKRRESVAAKPSNDTPSTYTAARYEIAPPAGWKKIRTGRRTIWQGPQDAQLLVETTSQAGASPRADWEKLDRDLSKAYGRRYRSLGIRESTLAGHPAAIWEFELESKSGQVTRKIDIAVHHRGRGYAVLGSAPAERFDELRPQLESAINSFRLKSAASVVPGSGESASADPESPPVREDIYPEEGY